MGGAKKRSLVDGGCCSGKEEKERAELVQLKDLCLARYAGASADLR